VHAEESELADERWQALVTPRAQLALGHESHDVEHCAPLERLDESARRAHDTRRMGYMQRRYIETDLETCHGA